MLNFEGDYFYITIDGFVLHDGIVWEVVGFGESVVNLKMIRNPERTAVFMVKEDFKRVKEYLEQFIPKTIDPDQIREQEIIQENSHGFGVNVDNFIWMQNRKPC
jgi:hypothetical protein